MYSLRDFLVNLLTKKEINYIINVKMIITIKKEVNMSIVLIGGHDRMHNLYKQLSTTLGHEMKVMTHLEANFTKRIGKPDGIIIFTNTVSHKMVKSAVLLAKKMEVPVVKSHSSSKSALQCTVKKLEKILYK